MATELHRIHGTDVSFFTSNPKEFDLKALESLAQVKSMGPDQLAEVCDDNVRLKDPLKRPGDLFLSREPGLGLGFLYPIPPQGSKTEGEWKHTSRLGFMHPTYLKFMGFKECYVYYDKYNCKTNWIMIVYSMIDENSFVEIDEVRLCHVFQCNNYKLCPDKRDFPELDERNRVALAVITTDNKRKRWSKVWKHFTEIQVLGGPNGVVAATLAICNHCSMVYKTGIKVLNEQDVYNHKNHGTNTLKNHKDKYCTIR